MWQPASVSKAKRDPPQQALALRQHCMGWCIVCCGGWKASGQGSPAAGGLLAALCTQKMEAWTYQKGYPLITASMDGDGNVYLQQASA
jgi:hypothetical protein